MLHRTGHISNSTPIHKWVKFILTNTILYIPLFLHHLLEHTRCLLLSYVRQMLSSIYWIYTALHLWICVCFIIINIYLYMCVCVYPCRYLHWYMYTYRYIYMWVCVCVHACRHTSEIFEFSFKVMCAYICISNFVRKERYIQNTLNNSYFSEKEATQILQKKIFY